MPYLQVKLWFAIYMQLKRLPHKNSQAVKNDAALKSLCEKSCEIKGGGQEMAAMMLMLINFNNAHSLYKNFLALTSLQPFLGRHL